MKKDIIAKETIEAITYDIATYILKLNISKKFKFLDKELKTIEKREADIVVLCKIDDIEQILHIEIQNNNDYNMPQRMLRYYNDIKIRYPDTTINQFVIYIGKNKLYMKNYIKDKNLSFNYNIIDMHNIDCEELIKLDTPDALVLSILCDFKGKDELEILTFLLQRLNTLTQNDNHKLSKYMLMLETLSENRDLKNKLKEAEDMLRTTRYEDLPSYEIGLERGMEKAKDIWYPQGLSQGLSQGTIKTAVMMINEFKLDPKEVAKKLNISLDEIKKYL